MAPKQKRVALYLRVSTADQRVENQRLDLARVAEQRGWRIVGEYVDHGISGAKGRDKRPEFDRLCKDAAQGKLDIVAAWSIDRIGRSLGHLVQFVQELRDQKVDLYLHKQAVDTSTAAGRMFLNMVSVFAEFEREVIVERIHAGLARARSQGKHLGRPTSVTSRTEQRIRELHAEGVGMLRIARALRCGVGTVQRVLRASARA
jgi:DNA invertase Pin-like site-specific DNA recombinase